MCQQEVSGVLEIIALLGIIVFRVTDSNYAHLESYHWSDQINQMEREMKDSPNVNIGYLKKKSLQLL